MGDKVLVNYSESFGRMGGLEELFVVTHAETSTCDDSTLRIVCDDPDWIARGIEYRVLSCCPGFVVDLVADWHDIGDGESRTERMRAALSPEDFRVVCEQWGLDL